MIECACRIEREKQLFLRHIPHTKLPDYRNDRFEALDPLNNSFCFTGNLDSIWALMRGYLGPLHREASVRTVDTFEIAGYYGQGDDCAEMQDLFAATVVIFFLSGVTKSPKMNQIVRWLYQMRIARGKPVWFVTEKFDNASYERETARLIEQQFQIDIMKYRQPGVSMAPIVSPKIASTTVKEVESETVPVELSPKNLEQGDEYSDTPIEDELPIEAPPSIPTKRLGKASVMFKAGIVVETPEPTPVRQKRPYHRKVK